MTRPIAERFAAELRRLLVERELSQAALAEAAGVQPSAMTRWLAGGRVPSLDNVERLADALDVTVDQLLGRDTEGPGALSDAALVRELEKRLRERR